MTEAEIKAGLYIHIPFCVQKCLYCDFYSISDLSRQKAYLDALDTEMRLCRLHAPVFDTLYLGGGTPSSLPLEAIDAIIYATHAYFSICADNEITIEVNPGTVDVSKLRAYRQAGINRISLGIQSFNQTNLDFLGRIHTVRESKEAFHAARQAGFANIGIDLIYGLPDQTRNAWQAELASALALQPEHLACYMLTYESDTPLDHARRNGRIAPLGEDESARLLTLAEQFLGSHGYVQYEISNFARSANGNAKIYRSRHNLKYWNKTPYLGLGPSAHSYAHPLRWWNIRHLDDYIKRLDAGRLPIAAQERLNREQQMIESLYLGLRQTAGVDVADFGKDFGVDFRAHFGAPLGEMMAEGVLTITKNRCALTPKGMRLLDSVVARLV